MKKTIQERKEEAYKEYIKIAKPFLREYNKTVNPAWKEYQRRCKEIDKESD